MRIKKIINSTIFQSPMVFFVVFGFFLFFQFQIPDFLGRDAYYHIKIAKMMGEGRLVFDDFPWLYFTTLRENFADQHFLFHLSLAPFLFLGDFIFPFFKRVIEGDLISPFVKGGTEGGFNWDFTGVKIATVIFSSAAVFIFYLILKKNKIFGAPIWIILLLGVSSGFIFRMNLVQAQGLAMAWLLLGFLALTRRKYFWLLPISFFYSWTHGGFILILVMIIVWSSVGSLNLLRKKLVEIKSTPNKFGHLVSSLGFVFVGLTLGILFHPYFPEILSFLKLQLFETGPFAEIKVGAEWYPYQTKNLLLGSSLVFIFFAASFFVLIKNCIFERKWVKSCQNKSQNCEIPRPDMIGTWNDIENTFAVPIFTLAILSTFFFLLTLRSQRFIEYWVPITILFAAFVLSEDLKRIFEYVLKLKNLTRHAIIKLTVLSLFLIVVVFSWVWAIYITQKSIKGSYSQEYAQAGAWLKNNTPKKSIIANLDWSDFPPLFYYNDQNYYISGLDQTFFYKYDKELYQKYEDIASGKNFDKAPKILKQDFKTNYVVVNNKFNKLEEKIKKDNQFNLVYKNEYLRIYKIIKNGV